MIVNKQKRGLVEYPTFPSAIRTHSHSYSLPVRTPTKNFLLEIRNKDTAEEEESNTPLTFSDLDF